MDNMMRRIVSGAAGAGVLTAIHETARRARPDAPRMDVVGMRAISRAVRLSGSEPPPRDRLFAMTFAGDLVANAAYYSAIPARNGHTTWVRAAALGLAAGLGACYLPRYLGLGDPPNSGQPANQVMTVAWYLAGALATAAVSQMMSSDARAVTA